MGSKSEKEGLRQRVSEAVEKRDLLKFATDLTAKAKEGKIDPVVGREKEIEQMIEILSRRKKNNPVLIGDPGVGKTAIVEGLALRIASGEVPEGLKDKIILSIDMTALVAGTGYRGDFEGRLKRLLDKIESSPNQYILFIDEMHTLVGAGAAEGALDAGNILKPALANGTLHAIGATTTEEYRRYIEKDPALERRFQPILVEEPSEETAIAILKGIRPKYEQYHQVGISDSAIVAAVKLSSRYVADRFLPDKAIDAIDEAAAKVRIKNRSLNSVIVQTSVELQQLRQSPKSPTTERKIKELSERLKGLERKKIVAEVKKSLLLGLKEKEKKLEQELAEWQKRGEIAASVQILIQLKEVREEIERAESSPSVFQDEVTEEDIAQVISQKTGIPLTNILSDEMEKLEYLEEGLRERVIGQDEAIVAVANAIRRQRTGLSDPKRPAGSFLFLGPTGVGKTETAKALAETLFGDPEAMIRIDLSEYHEQHSVARLFGAPPGYVGYDEAGQLTEAVRRRPYSIVLFDEMEKAHPEVLNSLLQVLDDGRMTDGQGRTINFRNTIIIFTSNLGNEVFRQQKNFQEQERMVLEVVRKALKPEFFNRLDSVDVFHPLSQNDIRQIVEIRIQELEKRLEESEIILEITEEAKNYLGEAGFDPVYGGRPLKRVIEQQVTDKIAMMVVQGEIEKKQKVKVDYQEGEIKISVLKV